MPDRRIGPILANRATRTYDLFHSMQAHTPRPQTAPSGFLIRGVGPRPVVPGDPYADLNLDGYDLVKSVDPLSLAPEIALIRSFIRQHATLMQAPGLTRPQILTLQRHSCL